MSLAGHNQVLSIVTGLVLYLEMNFSKLNRNSNYQRNLNYQVKYQGDNFLELY